MKMNKCLIWALVLLFYSTTFYAQGNDSLSSYNKLTLPDSSNQVILTDTTVSKKHNHSPLKAVLLSAALPGLGQAYNKKYWKIPIIYAGIGGLSYLIYFENVRYQGFRKAYTMQVDGNPYTQGIYNNTSNVSNLEISKNYYRRNLDLACVGMFVWYALNLVDATVDGHLFKFDVSDDLSFHLEPHFEYSAMLGNQRSTSFGLKLQITL